MSLDRHLARLLAVVITLIAATFGVSVAHAHEGHAHHHASAAPVVTAPVQEAAQPAAVPVIVKADSTTLGMVALVTQATPAAAKTVLSIAAPRAGDCDDCGGCNGLCCGMGMVCCHSALTPASFTAVTPAMLAVLVPLPQQAAHPSLTPEALPKPPRSFA